MSSTTYFTKGHSTRISPPCGNIQRGAERFGLRILFAGLFFVLLFGLFTVPVAGETTTVEVSTFEELQSEISSTTVEKTIIIAEDIMASEPLVIYSGQSITLMSDAETDRCIYWAAAPVPSSNMFGNGWIQVAGNLIVSGNDSGATVTNLTLEGSMDEENGNSLVYVSGSFTLEEGGILSSNYKWANTGSISNSGAGVFIYSGRFTMNGGEIRDCYADDDGGGVYLSWSGTFGMNGGTITGNTANGSNGGGGLFISDGTFNMSGGDITGNGARYYGGGIYLADGSASLSGDASVIMNKAEMNGGVWINTDTTFILTGNAEISGNTATSYSVASEIMTNAAVIQISGSPAVGSNGVCLSSVTDYEGNVLPSYILVTGDLTNVKIENIGGYNENDKLVRWTGEKPNGVSSETFILSNNYYTLVEDAENKALVVTYNQNPTEEYTITFNSNGGTGSMTSATVFAGESYILPDCTFTAPEGKVFKAWLIGSTEYAAGTSYTPTASVTVKAVWTVEDTTAPGIFTINPLENGIVSWTVSEGATGYKFSLRDRTISETEDIGKKVNNEDVGTATNYDISSHLVEGHSYRVAVCAYNDAGKETWAELEFGDCQHTTAVNVDITYNGITKDFPQDAGDGRTHYWYVNKVCDDCKTVLESNVQSTAVHNANTLEKNGVCECNYHTITAELSKTMYAVEDTNTYLAPEASDGYHGGSIDKDEEVTVLAEGLGVDGSWSLIQYSVTGTSREKVRFVKSESLESNEEVTITIFYPTEDTVCLANENPEIHWISSKDTVAEYEVRLYSEDNRLLGHPSVIPGSNGIYNYNYTIPENYILGGTKSYKVVVGALSNSGEVIGEDTVSFKIENPFVFPDDTWGFCNSYSDFGQYMNRENVLVWSDTEKKQVISSEYIIPWEDFSAVYGDSHISKKIYEDNKIWRGTCAGMMASIIGVNNNLLPIEEFTLNTKAYSSPYDIKRKDMRATHSLFPSSINGLVNYLMQLQYCTLSKTTVDVEYANGFDDYEEIVRLIGDGHLVYLGMCRWSDATGGSGGHAILGYAVDVVDLGDGYEYITLHTYDPNFPGTSTSLVMLRLDGVISEWSYIGPEKPSSYDGVYNSEYHALSYLSDNDIIDLFFDYDSGKDFEFEFKDENENVCILPVNVNDNENILHIGDTNKKEILQFYDSSEIFPVTKMYRIPKGEIQLISSDGGKVTILDTHSSVEITLDAGTTASVIVDDAKENSVEITSDDENTNHEFTVTYGYDSTADKGYQEATVKGTMSDTFKGEATENGLKLTGLDSAEILVENSKGESVSVGTIQNADEYEDIVIDIDTSVKVTGNKDGVSDVLVSVPLNKVQYESSGSSKDTGSGNYAEYPRIVTNGGYVDFGTSPVVKGVTLPEGVSGKVVLIAKSETTAPEGKEAYGVFEINVASYPTGEKSVISFTIPLSDLQEKGFTEKDICLYHFDGDVWTKLPTTYTVEGDKVFYQAETTAFSPFAIVYEKDGATSAAVSEIPVEPEKPSDETVSTVPEVPSSSEPQETESPAPVLGMMLGGLGAAVLMRRK